jgi:hypothetical protein
MSRFSQSDEDLQRAGEEMLAAHSRQLMIRTAMATKEVATKPETGPVRVQGSADTEEDAESVADGAAHG